MPDAHRRGRARVVGVAAALILIAAGTAGWVGSTASGGEADVAHTTPTDPAVGLVVRVEETSRTLRASPPTAEWNTTTDTVVYTSALTFRSGCIPRATATIDDTGELVLRLDTPRNPTPAQDCTTNDVAIRATVEGLASAPTGFQVVENTTATKLSLTRTRLIGIGRVAVAVPEDWETTGGNVWCDPASARAAVAGFPCEAVFPEESASVALETSEPEDRSARPDGMLGGRGVVARGFGCLESMPAQCYAQFAVPELDASVTIRLVTRDSRDPLMNAIRDSLDLLPAGLVTVPAPQGSAASTATTLRTEGFRTKIIEHRCDAPTCPAVPVEVSPPPGTVVDRGSLITLTTYLQTPLVRE